MKPASRKTSKLILAICALAIVPACQGFGRKEQSVYAPALNPRGDSVDGLVVGHRLMAAGQYELALEAYTRAAGEHGLTPEILSALGTANLGLARLNQAEKLLRRAVAEDPDRPESWNNLGVVLMERDKTAEAEQMFTRAYALDNGKSDSIRENLRRALAKLNETTYDGSQEQEEYKIVRRGSGDYLIVSADG